MKRFLLLAVAVLAFVGCNNAFEDEGNARFEQTTLPTLMAGFEEDTRTYVEQNTYLRWHADDRLTIFYGNTMNRQYRFNGKSGDNSGSFSHIPSGNIETGNSCDHIYAVYPYDAAIGLDDINKSMSLTLPAEQTYAEDSFGRGANVMVAATESVDDKFLSFKNVGGYLKIKLYGEGTVKSIELRGNNGEKIAGNVNITATYGGVPKIAMADDATESIMLDCGSGVMLSSDAENPTEFWVVVPPTEFSKGITISITNAYNAVFEKSTSNKIVVERNIIQPMSAVEVMFEEVAKPAHNEIWYTSSDGNIIEPKVVDVFGAYIIDNRYDNGRGVITFHSDVTTIGERAFYDCDSLTSVTIGDSVTTIGDEAFYECKKLTSVTIPDSVTAIGDSAFYWCSSLTSITIPDSVTTIGDEAFYECKKLTSVTIPDSVTAIGDSAFYWCSSLTSITIPDSVTTIGDEAFSSCGSLTSVTIGDSVTTIGWAAFIGCSNLTSITIPDSVTTIGEWAFAFCPLIKEFKGKYATDNGRCLIVDNTLIAYANKSGTEYTIPDSVTTIGGSAFSYCNSLTSVTISDSVTTIGYQAFVDCDSLTSVTIPDSVITIRDYAFSYCSSLTSVTIGDSVTTIGDGAFYECNSLRSVTIPDSVTTIGDSAFSSCDSLTSITIPDSVTTIGGYAFYSCDSLTSITIPDSVTTIGGSAFNGCSSLTSVTIPDSVTTIGRYAFYYCTSLTSVIIGDSVTAIGNFAFSYCDKIKYIYCKPTTPPTLYSNSFSSDVAPTKIYVPTNSVNVYKTAKYWRDYADVITGFNF